MDHRRHAFRAHDEAEHAGVGRMIELRRCFRDVGSTTYLGPSGDSRNARSQSLVSPLPSSNGPSARTQCSAYSLEALVGSASGLPAPRHWQYFARRQVSASRLQTGRRTDAALLFDAYGLLNVSEVSRLLLQRDDRRVHLRE